LKAAISATYVLLSVTVLLLSWDNYKFALGQAQQQFQNYQNPTLGFSIQYPSDWQIEEEPGEQVTFVKENDIVESLVDVHSLDSPDITLAKYVQDEITNKREERQGFKLVESTPMTISDGKAPAHKLVYTFLKEDEPRSGETNKIQRIYTIEGDKVYSIAYLAEVDKYDDSLPLVEKMVDSFRISDSDSGSSTTQVQSSDRSSEDNNGTGNCDRISYPDPNVCIPPYPPDLNCPDISYTNFQVTDSDPHGFDRDKDGIGCESTEGGGVTPPDNGDGTPPPERDCDPSYPGVCIKSPPPDLNCPDIPDKNFRVTGSDPHGFDRDNDGIGCESAVEDTPTPEPDNGDGCVEVDGYLLSKGSYLDERKRIVGSPCDPVEFCSDVGSTNPTVRDHCMDIWLDFDCDDPGMENDPRCIDGDRNPCYPDPTSPECITRTPMPTPTDYCYLPGIGDWWDNPDCREYLEDKYKNMNKSPPPPPSPPTPPQCDIDDSGNEVCPPTDGLTPIPEPPIPEPPTPEPTPTPDEEFTTEEEPEEEGEEATEDESQEETEEESEGNGESNAGSTFE
jgi:hypothetical protein